MQIDNRNIEKYIQGELNGNELTEFEAALKKDEALQKKVHFYQYAMSTLSENKVYTKEEVDKIAQINPLLEEMRNKHFINKTTITETPQKDAKSIPTIVRRLFPLATLAAAAVLIIFFFLPQEPKFEPYPLSYNPMGPDTDKLYKKAIVNYKDKNYQEANKLFDTFLNENPKAPEVWLAKGCALFKLNNINEALISFEKAIEIDDSGISHAYANWYIALCYLKKDNREKAIHHLKKIKEETDKYLEAKRLLRQLE